MRCSTQAGGVLQRVCGCGSPTVVLAQTEEARPACLGGRTRWNPFDEMAGWWVGAYNGLDGWMDAAPTEFLQLAVERYLKNGTRKSLQCIPQVNSRWRRC